MVETEKRLAMEYVVQWARRVGDGDLPPKNWSSYKLVKWSW